MKRWIKRTISGLAAALMLAAPITSSPVLPAVQTQLAEAATTKSKYTLNKTSLKLYYYPEGVKKDSSYPSSYTLKLSGVGNKKVTWKSSNKRVATVSSKGKVTIQGGWGTATITATCGSVKRTCKITANWYNEAEDILIESKNRVCDLGSYIYLAASVYAFPDCITNRKLTYTSSNPEIAKVNQYGKVTGLKEGTATITIKTGNGNLKKKCKVTVKEIAQPGFEVDFYQEDEKANTWDGTTLDLYAITDEDGKVNIKCNYGFDEVIVQPMIDDGKIDTLPYSDEDYYDYVFESENQFPDMNAKIRNFEVTSSSKALIVDDGTLTIADKAENAVENVTLTVKSNYDGTKREIPVCIHYMTESEYSLQAGYAFAEQLNVYRKALGLEEVKYLDKAQPASDLRTQQITEYFSHVLPEGTGGGPFVQTGIIPKHQYISDYYTIASGEVIAKNCFCGWTTSPEIAAKIFLEQWKTSAGHWAILTGTSQRYVTLGIAWKGVPYAQAYTYWDGAHDLGMKYVLGEITQEEFFARIEAIQAMYKPAN